MRVLCWKGLGFFLSCLATQSLYADFSPQQRENTKGTPPHPPHPISSSLFLEYLAEITQFFRAKILPIKNAVQQQQYFCCLASENVYWNQMNRVQFFS
jgi:hypothetical protein